MNLSNKWTSDLLKKDKNISFKAAEHIINNIDLEAWQCLLENSEYIFDFIKSNAQKKLANKINENNVFNLFHFLKIYSSDWDDFIARTFADFSNDEIKNTLTAILEDGSNEEKAYAAKYFCYVKSEDVKELLFDCAKNENENLKLNAARALGNIKDEVSYNYFIEKLKSEDDWEKVEASQFLSAYGNKEAVPSMLKAMSVSGMSEYIAGDIATLDNFCHFFDSDNSELKELSLECFDNILSGLAENWSLESLIDFNIYECIENLVYLVNNDKSDIFTGRFSQLLLKTFEKLKIFKDNDIYRFDESKQAVEELNEICRFLESFDKNFWDNQKNNVLKELGSKNEQRKLSSLEIIKDLQIKEAIDDIKKILEDKNEVELVLFESLNTLKELEYTVSENEINDLINRFNDDNLIVAAQNIFKY